MESPSFLTTSVPEDCILQTSAPLDVWKSAQNQALRSPMVRFRAGAVIWDPSDEKIISTGCSHPDVVYARMASSVHAECHALRRAHRRDFDGLWCIIFTYGRRGGSAWSSRPCYSCASRLDHCGVERVVYPERTRKGWVIRGEHPEELLGRAPEPAGPFARQQRIPA